MTPPPVHPLKVDIINNAIKFGLADQGQVVG